MLHTNNNYTFSLGSHYEKAIIWIHFPKEISLINNLKQLCPAAKWSASQKCWYVCDVTTMRQQCNLPIKTYGKDAYNKIHPINLPAFNRYIEHLKLKAYSTNTIRTYAIEFIQLLFILKNYNVDTLNSERIRDYILFCISQLKMSENHLHSRINAIKFYFEQVLKRDKFFIEIPRPKKPPILPKVLSTVEIKRLLNIVSKNSKHLLMLKLCYGMGLRVSEIVALKIKHIDSSRMQVLIEAAKGKKDRYVTLPNSVLQDLRTYYLIYRPLDYLFQGQYGGQYSIRSVQSVFKKAMTAAKISKQIGIHCLRHSFATHLLESGTDISYIQQLLGHNNINTTLIYTQVSNKHLSKIKSPLDSL